MSKISDHIFFIPTLIFLVVVLSGLTLPIHHIHLIEVAPPSSGNHPSDNHRHDDAAETKSNTPSTYHEVHFVTLLSDDSFSALNRTDAFAQAVQVMAILPNSVEFLASPSSEVPLISLKEPSSSPSQDKYVLFCSFLI